MSVRRTFLKQSGLLGTAAILHSKYPWMGSSSFPVVRTPASMRRFSSPAVESLISRMVRVIRDPEIAWMFGNCFPNTLDTTVYFTMKKGRADTFVITGDIHAMWLRDSSAQVWPYLPLMKDDTSLQTLIAGVINRQIACILIDPYANAFNEGPTGSPWDKDLTVMKPGIHERKWELDSLCYPIRLAFKYWTLTGDTSPFDQSWRDAMALILNTFIQQQRMKDHGPYRFDRVTSWSTDTVPGDGYGNPIKPVGLIVSVFRPSDDATIFPFLIPSNLFAVISLRQLAEMSLQISKDQVFAKSCLDLAAQVEAALKIYGMSVHGEFGSMFPYEVDGFGNRLFMDDSNVPSLLALPYLQCTREDDPVYLHTRQFIFSRLNPYFFQGHYAEGSGSPHTLQHMVWPMSIIIRAMTSREEVEICNCLRMLKLTHAGTGFMHESFDPDHPAKFTRKWFAWANTLFGEMILKIWEERPGLLEKTIF